MNLQLIQYKELVIKTIRDYLYQRGFHEVSIPTLQSSVPLEPNIYPFTATWNTTRSIKQLFLSTSPESALKKYLAAGGGNCFALSPAFRNFEETSPTHLPEFLMLEWYRLNGTYLDAVKETQQLISYVDCHCEPRFNRGEAISKINFNQCAWPQFTMIELFQKHVGVSLQEHVNNPKMIALATQKGYNTVGASWEQLFNQIFLNEVEPHLGPEPCFVTDYPTKTSPLCKKKENNPDFAERFELYINGMELANGNTENTDIKSIKKTFSEENKYRKTKGLVSPPVDESFLNALAALKTKRVCGVGLGIDRLIMILSGVKDIRKLGCVPHP